MLLIEKIATENFKNGNTAITEKEQVYRICVKVVKEHGENAFLLNIIDMLKAQFERWNITHPNKPIKY